MTDSNNNMPPTLPGSAWKTFLEINHQNFRLIAHLAGSAALFFCLALLAALIRLFTTWIEGWVGDPVIVFILTGVEYGILVFDVVLIGIVLWHTIKHIAKGE